MTWAVDIQQVGKTYGSLKALDNVSLQIGQGEFFGLLGPNGAGKSTLIGIMAGLVNASSGSVSILGADVVQDYRQARLNLGVVPQEVVSDPFFTVREALRLQSGYFGLGKANHAWVDGLIDGLNLSDKANVTISRLSGGMKRRVMIAQALVHKPKVLVLDEPTAGVDVELRRSMWEFVRELHHNGTTIVLTTHYLEEAEALCGRIGVINRGQLQALESKRDLLARHPWRLVRLELKSGQWQPAQWLKPHVVSFEENVLTLRLDKQRDSLGELLKRLDGEGVVLNDIRTQEPRLEDVFMELVSGRSS